MKKKWITKAEIAAILKMYSIRKDEFELMGQTGYSYQSRYVRGYVLTLDEEIQYGNIRTGRIIVSHTQGNGKRTCQDIWDHDKDGKLLFCFRNLWNQPFSDVDYIKNLEQQVQTLKNAGQELQEKLQGISNTEKECGTGQYLYHELIEENKRLQKHIDILTAENQKLCGHNVRGAGRKPILNDWCHKLKGYRNYWKTVRLQLKYRKLWESLKAHFTDIKEVYILIYKLLTV